MKISPNSCGPSKTKRELILCREHHAEYTSFSCLVDGVWIEGECPLCEKEAEALARAQAESRRAELRVTAVFSRTGIPGRFIDKDFDSYVPASLVAEKNKDICMGYANNFDHVSKLGVCLTMCGGVGTGKTHLASAIGNQLTREGKQVLFVDTLEAVRVIRETWRDDSEKTERQVLKDFVAVDLLVLDEVGIQMGSRSEELIVFSIVQGRYKEGKPTVIISNLSEGELSGPLGEAGADRLKENKGPVLSFDWKSYRRG